MTTPLDFRRFRARGLVWFLLLAFGVAPLPAQDKTVSCTDADLRAKVVGGGQLTFADDCTITLTKGPVRITAPTTINANGHNVTIIGGSTNTLFVVTSNSTFALTGITLRNGHNTNGGALYILAGSSVALTNCLLAGNIATGTNGINGTNGAGGTTVGKNGSKGTSASDGFGGAIYNLGRLAISTCDFQTNSAIGGFGGNGGGGQSAGRGGNGGAGGNGGIALGGAIYNAGLLLVEKSVFSGNTSVGGQAGTGGAAGGGSPPGLAADGGAGGTASGAGLYNLQNNTNVTIVSCTFADNIATAGSSTTAGLSSGGIGNKGKAGGAGSGGGVFNIGLMVLTNSTFSENGVIGGNGGNGGNGGRGGNGGNGGNGAGGGLYSSGQVFAVSCTFAYSSAIGGTNGSGGSGSVSGQAGTKGKVQGSNIANAGVANAGNFFSLQNCIIANILSGATNALPGTNGFGTFIDEGFNISSDKSIKLDTTISETNLNPELDTLNDNGGPTPTIALLPESPALDRIDPADAPDFDQRGVSRPGGDLSDIGAFEVTPLSIITQPQSQTVTNGGTAMFFVSAIGDSDLTYAWRFNGIEIDGETETNLVISPVDITNAGNYDVVVSALDDQGDVSVEVPSDVAVLSVVFTPTISQSPTNQTVLQGDPVTFTVTAAGDAPLRFQWRFNGTNILGATNDTFSLSSVQPTNAGPYTVTVSNAFGGAVSLPGILTVGVRPTITVQPKSTNVLAGTAATFSVQASGSGTLNYQWRFNGAAIVGAVAPSFSRSSAQTNHAGTYDVVVFNVFGSVESAEATLGVLTQPSLGQLKTVSNNLSFVFQSQSNISYITQYKNKLTDSNWTALATNFGTGGPITNRFSTTNPASRFFRLQAR